LIRCARDLLDAREGITVSRVSEIYETEPLGPPQPTFLNAAFRLETPLSPPEVLAVLLRTERRLGRYRNPKERWGPRSIDLDLLWDDRGEHESLELHVPHAELENRRFALAPLLDVAPELDARFGSTLQALGGPPSAWAREAIVGGARTPEGFRADVEADSLADACALSFTHLVTRGRPHSTRHLLISPTAEAFASALREVLRTGFAPQCATMSHCSQSQWAVEFHGVNLGMPVAADVRLRTTLGAERENRVLLAWDGIAP
jgi:2-amino-4-hydroxy-6-hydroxymethyldihydropteridine diphosphokinase